MRKLPLVLAGLALAITPALADNTDTATVNVSGTIVAALAASVTNGLTMPHIVKPKANLNSGPVAPSGGNSTLSVTCSAAGVATLAYGPGANPFAAGNSAAATPQSGANLTLVGASAVGATGQCAKVKIDGEANYSFLTVVGAGTSPTTGVSISSTSCSSTASTSLGATGSVDIYCGAAVSVGTTASAGGYTGSFPVTVTYD